MAKIPIGNFNTSIPGQISSIDASIINRGTQFGEGAGLGGQIAAIGGDLMKKRYEAEALSSSSPALLELDKSINEYEMQQKIENKTGIDYAKNVTEFSQKKYKELAARMPSDLASEMFDNHANNFLAKNSLQSQAYENVTKAQTYEATLDVMKNDASQDVTPQNFSDRAKILHDYNENSVGILATPEGTARKRMEINDSLTNGMFEKMFNEKQYKSGLAFLKGENEYTSGMDANKKNAWIAKYQAKVIEEGEIKLSTINAMSENFIYDAVNKGKYNPSQLNTIIAGIKESKLPTYEKEEKIGKLMIAVQAGAEASKFHTLTNSQLSSYDAPSFGSQVPGAPASKVSGEMSKKLQVAAKSILAERNKDAPQYLMQNDQELQNLAIQSNGFLNSAASQVLLGKRQALQKQLGMSSQILTKSESDSIEKMIISAPNSSAAASLMSQYKESFGSNVQGAMNQIFKDKENQGLMLMGYVSDERSMARIFEDMQPKRKAEIEESFKSLDRTSIEVFNNALNMKMTPIVSAMSSSGGSGRNLGLSNAIQDVVGLEAKKIKASTNMTIDESINTAFNRIITPNFILGEGPSSNILIPIKSGNVTNNKVLIDEFLTKYSNADNLSQLDIKLPNRFQGTFETKKEFLTAVGNQMRWILSPRQNGLALVWDHPINGFYLVKDTKGKVIEKTFTEINNGQ